MDLVICQHRLALLKKRLVRLGFLNLFIVALLGLSLRSYPFSGLPLDYGKLLHGHSHFAFGGWLMPMMVWMIMQYFPSSTAGIGFHHWRNIATAVLVSAYGMLVSFPFQGYGVVSIFFSTLSVFAGFYLAVVLLKATLKEKERVSVMFLRWGLMYMTLSAIGAFATGPLVAMGRQGSWLYYDSVYFYLHFQYNGWLVFAVLSVLYRLFEAQGATHGKKVFLLLNLAVVPTYFLSTLWHHPPAVYYWIAGIASLLQLAALYFLIKDFLRLPERNLFFKRILWLVMIAFIVKNLLQSLGALPYVSDLAFQHRNLIIAYLHLVLLGMVSLFVIVMALKSSVRRSGLIFKTSLVVFIAGFVLTEALLVVNGLELMVTAVEWWLLGVSFLLVLGAFGMSMGLNEMGSWRSEVKGRKSEAGGRRLEVRSRGQKVKN